MAKFCVRFIVISFPQLTEFDLSVQKLFTTRESIIISKRQCQTIVPNRYDTGDSGLGSHTDAAQLDFGRFKIYLCSNCCDF